MMLKCFLCLAIIVTKCFANLFYNIIEDHLIVRHTNIDDALLINSIVDFSKLDR
jgi:hypothetical protein